LKTLVQLTGYFDPIYAETFVTVKNYDVFFDILLINNSTINLLNVQVEFSCKSEILVLEKAATVNIRPGQSITIRSHIKFVKPEFGSIFGSINYDNQAGTEQEIKIDFLQFIYPVHIGMPEFRILWKDKSCEKHLNKETNNT
jgi:coatomer subunit beta